MAARSPAPGVATRLSTERKWQRSDAGPSAATAEVVTPTRAPSMTVYILRMLAQGWESQEKSKGYLGGGGGVGVEVS
jgi:hypothetical protein